MAMRRQEYDDEHAEGIENETDIALELSPEIKRRIQKAAAENNLSVEKYLERVFYQLASSSSLFPQYMI